MNLKEDFPEEYQKSTEEARKSDEYRAVANSLVPFLRRCVSEGYDRDRASQEVLFTEYEKKFFEIVWDYDYLFDFIKKLEVNE
jgi:hypothetical protein